MKRLAVVAMVALAGCVSAEPQPTSTATVQPIRKSAPYALSAAELAKLKEAVRSSLKDPDSARFRGVSAYRQDDGKIGVCGFVNAKNSFGGYVGDRPFIASLIDGAFPMPVIASESNHAAFVALCREYGMLMDR